VPSISQSIRKIKVGKTGVLPTNPYTIESIEVIKNLSAPYDLYGKMCATVTAQGYHGGHREHRENKWTTL
jgi:hypothetical protein